MTVATEASNYPTFKMKTYIPTDNKAVSQNYDTTIPTIPNTGMKSLLGLRISISIIGCIGIILFITYLRAVLKECKHRIPTE